MNQRDKNIRRTFRSNDVRVPLNAQCYVEIFKDDQPDGFLPNNGDNFLCRHSVHCDFVQILLLIVTGGSVNASSGASRSVLRIESFSHRTDFAVTGKVITLDVLNYPCYDRQNELERLNKFDEESSD